MMALLWKLKGPIFAILIIGSAYGYYTWSRGEIEELRADNIEAVQMINKQQTQFSLMAMEQNAVIHQMGVDQTRISDSVSNLQILNAEQDKSLEGLRKIFNRESRGKKSLGTIAHAKPFIIKRKINRAVVKRVRCLEIASGAKLTQKERDDEYKNSVCDPLIVRVRVTRD